MRRNNTPKEIASYIALYITLLWIVIMSVILFITDAHVSSNKFPLIILASLAGYVVVYFLVQKSIDKFLYKRIKLIYKNIHTLKTSSAAVDQIDTNADVIGSVNKEVTEWANDSRKEIDSLKKQEAFRKEFIGNLAHELKTPLFSIQGYLHTLLEGGLYDENINENYLKRTDKNVDRLIDLVNDLDDISKIESGTMKLKFSTFSVSDMANEIMQQVQDASVDKNINISVKTSLKKVPEVWADQKKVSQVLYNLVMNSIKYGNEGGHTTIKFHDMDEHVLVEVKDDGIGISEDHLPRIFERFYRIDSSRSRHVGGSGLGLAIVKHILDAHQESINVRSGVDEGTTFSFTLKKA